MVQKRNVCATEFVSKSQVAKRAQQVILHTRFATQGAPEYNVNNHPVTSGPHDNIIVGVHNGMVYNDNDIFFDIETAEGLAVRRGEVDSEAIFAALAYGLPDAKDYLDVLENIGGSAAIAYFKDQEPGRLYVARLASSPLIMVKTFSGSTFFASTTTALSDVAKSMDLDGTKPLSQVYAEVVYSMPGEHYVVDNGTVTDRAYFAPEAQCWGGYQPRSTGDWRTSGITSTMTTTTPIEHDERRAWTPEKRDSVEIAPNHMRFLDPGEHRTEIAWPDPEWTVIDRGLLRKNVALVEDKANVDIYTERDHAIDSWIEQNSGQFCRFDKTYVESRISASEAMPGDWVRITLGEQDINAQLVSLSPTFPQGIYLCRALVPRPGLLKGSDIVLVEKAWTDITWVGRARPESARARFMRMLMDTVELDPDEDGYEPTPGQLALQQGTCYSGTIEDDELDDADIINDGEVTIDQLVPHLALV